MSDWDESDFLPDDILCPEEETAMSNVKYPSADRFCGDSHVLTVSADEARQFLRGTISAAKYEECVACAEEVGHDPSHTKSGGCREGCGGCKLLARAEGMR